MVWQRYDNMDMTPDNPVWTVRDANKCNKVVETDSSRLETEDDSNNNTTTCCKEEEEHLLNSPFESFSPSSRRGASSHGQSVACGENDGGETSPKVVYHHHHHHHHRETAKMPTTASHPKSTTAFRQLSDLLWQAQLNSVARRNERERKRVKLVNNGFAALRQKIPSSSKLKADFSSKSSKASKLSKVETLRSAIKYINHLQYLLKECSPNPESIRSADVIEPMCVVSSEAYSDSESVNYNTDSSVFSDNTNNTGHIKEVDVACTTKHSAESYAISNDKLLSFTGYEPIHYTQSSHNDSSYSQNNSVNQNYHCYTSVAQNELFSSW